MTTRPRQLAPVMARLQALHDNFGRIVFGTEPGPATQWERDNLDKVQLLLERPDPGACLIALRLIGNFVYDAETYLDYAIGHHADMLADYYWHDTTEAAAGVRGGTGEGNSAFWLFDSMNPNMKEACHLEQIRKGLTCSPYQLVAARALFRMQCFHFNPARMEEIVTLLCSSRQSHAPIARHFSPPITIRPAVGAT